MMSSSHPSNLGLMIRMSPAITLWLSVFKRILRFLKSPVSCLDRRLNGCSLRGRDASHQPADVMHSLLRWVSPETSLKNIGFSKKNSGSLKMF